MRLFAAILIALAPAAASAETVGLVTKVQADSYQSGGLFGAALSAEDAIYRDAEVYTKDYGTVQIRFVDETDLLISPNSRVLIDEYVYSSDPSAARLAMNLTKGALRIISGKIPKPAQLVRTQVASIGVRGTTYWLDVDEPGITKIWVDDGAVEARPVASQDVFVFSAPVYAECNEVTCYETEAPPKPVKFPLDPRSESWR